MQCAVKNQKSAISWKIVNKVSGRKNSSRSKIKAKNDEERVKQRHKHFQDLLSKCPRITENEEISRSVHCELNINKGPFTSDEINKAVKSIINGKAAGLDKIPAEFWKLEAFINTYYYMYATVYIIRIIYRNGTKDVYYRFQKNKT